MCRNGSRPYFNSVGVDPVWAWSFAMEARGNKGMWKISVQTDVILAIYISTPAK